MAKDHREWRWLCTAFFTAIATCSVQDAKSVRGLALIDACDWGKHRSTGGICLLAICCYRDHWQVNGEYRMLNKQHWNRRKCGWTAELGGHNET